MLTNEKRAHDIALVLLSNMLAKPENYILDNIIPGNKIELNVAKKYLEYYELALREINKAFPKE